MTTPVYCPTCKSKAVDGVISHMTGCPYNPKVVKAALAREKKKRHRRHRREDLRWWLQRRTGLDFGDWLIILVVIAIVLFFLLYFMGVINE